VDPRYPNIAVQLKNRDGNAFVLIGRTAQALRGAGVAAKEVKEFRTECMSGDYDYVLQTCMKWVDVQGLLLSHP
jgi:hypothetical protein